MSTPTTLERPQTADAPDAGGATSSTRQYVTFMAGDEVFAVDMAPVQEIIRVPEVVRVPMATSYLGRLGQSARPCAAHRFTAPCVGV